MLIVKFSDGRASGDAFAVFDSDINLEKALEKDKTSMGSRYVELFRSSVKEFQLVRWLCFSNHVPPSTGVILLQVYLAKMVLFSPLHFILLPLLSSLPLYSLSSPFFLQVLNRSGSQEQQRRFVDMLGLSMEQDSEGDGLRGRERNCVKLRGLPWSATPEDVIRFFGELKDDISTHGVHMVLNAMVSIPTYLFVCLFVYVPVMCVGVLNTMYAEM